jgi:hypothetical protein
MVPAEKHFSDLSKRMRQALSVGGASAPTDPPEEARRIAASIAKLPAFLRPKHQR